MKKFISVLAALMVLVMGTTVFAASPTTETQQAQDYLAAVSKVTDADGNNVSLTAASTDVIAAAERIANVSVKTVVNVEGITLAAGETATLTFSVSGITAGADIQVLHWDGTKWESDSVSGVRVEDGKVTATFSSLSPIAIVEKTQGATAPETTTSTSSQTGDNTAATATTTVTSPQTGENATLLPVLAVICLAGVVVCTRKVKFN